MSDTTSQEGWFYAAESGRVGPVTADAISALREEGKIGDHTLLWRQSFGSEWRPFSTVEEFRDTTLPPPLPIARINNTYANIYCVVPLIGMVVESILGVRGVITSSTPVMVVVLAYVIVYALLMQLDFKEIARSGNETVNTGSVGWTVVVAPVYLYIRDKRLGFGQTRLVVMIAALIAGFFLPGSGFLPGLTAGATGTIPACDAGLVTDVVRRNFAQIGQNLGTSLAARSVTEISTVSSDNIQRMCSAKVTGTNNLSYRVGYRVYLENNQVMVYTTMQ